MNLSEEFSRKFVADFRRESAKRVAGWPEVETVYEKFSKFAIRVLGHINEFVYTGELWSQNSGSNSHRSKWSWLSTYLYRLIYCFVILRTTVNCAIQYRYDYLRHKYKIFQRSLGVQRNQLNAGATLLADKQLNQLAEELSETRALLKTIGAPYINLSGIIEVALIYVSATSLASYVQTHLYFRFIQPYDLSIMRSIMNKKREQIEYVDNLILSEVKSFIASARFYLRFPPEDRSTLNNSWNIETIKPREETRRYNYFKSKVELCELDEGKQRSKEKMALDIKDLNEELRQMALGGQLNPPNKSCEWIQNITRLYGSFLIGYYLFNGINTQIFISLMPLIKFASVDFLNIETRMDLVALIEFYMICLYSGISCGPQLVNLFATSHDQANYLLELRQMIGSTISINNKLLIMNLEMVEPNNNSSRLPANVQREMNVRFLYTFMHYKIFVRQFKAIKRVFNFLALVGVELCVLSPVLCRLNCNLMDQGEKVVIISFTIGFIVLGDSIVMPMLGIHRNSVKLQQVLESLLAHAVQCNLLAGSQVYNGHLVWLLRKELNQVEQSMAVNTISCFGVPLTYPNVLKFHFYCGILILTTIFSSMENSAYLFSVLR